MKNLDYNCTALTDFDRFEFAVNGGIREQAPLDRARCRYKQKSDSAELFRLY